ncbi:MAG: flavodoxin [Pseudomonadota bacterium]
MDNVLVVAYSNTGQSLRLARLLCSHTGWPLATIADEKPRAGAAGTLRCMLDSLLRRKPAIRYEGPDPADFRTVVLVSPIWMRRLSGPMRSFVAGRCASLRRVAVISTMNSAGAENAVAEIGGMTACAPYLGSASLVHAVFTSREIDNGDFGGRLEEFARQLQPGASIPHQQSGIAPPMGNHRPAQ